MLPRSIHGRLQAGIVLALLCLLLLAGWALDARYASHLRDSHYKRLQSEIYLLLAAVELDARGQLLVPPALAEPLLTLPQSGLYAEVATAGEEWRSPSSIGLILPRPQPGSVGQWLSGQAEAAGKQFLTLTLTVDWRIGGAQRIQFIVYEDQRDFLAQLKDFRLAMAGWLSLLAVVLLVVQSVLLRWALGPLRRVERELQHIEAGEQALLAGPYPPELLPLTDRLNRLVVQERARQQRYREALADLAHSLKTPLAVLQHVLMTGAQPAEIEEQLRRMDQIVQHQLARASARGTVELAPPLPLASVIARVVAALRKVYAAEALNWQVHCPESAQARIDEADAFEMIGNLLDNAAKWAKDEIRIVVTSEGGRCLLVVHDDGPGFSAEALQYCRGVRADESVPGQGIGLSVVFDLADAYGGTLTLSNDDGAVVTLVLPA
ncbi:ATP-binding protein [Chitinibacteraceae bacterium HSL-7]